MERVARGKSPGSLDLEKSLKKKKSCFTLTPGRKNDVISCHALTPDFLIYGTDMGGLVVFFLEDWDNVHEFKHNAGIKDIVAEPNGTKVRPMFSISMNEGISAASFCH